jgi:hypothetical protein
MEQKTVTELKEVGVRIRSRLPCLCRGGCTSLRWRLFEFFIVGLWLLWAAYVVLMCAKVITIDVAGWFLRPLAYLILWAFIEKPI